jgi:PKD repeat protein
MPTDTVSSDGVLVFLGQSLSAQEGDENESLSFKLRVHHTLGRPVTFEFDFGDGSPTVTSTDPTASHRYIDDPYGLNDSVVVKTTVRDDQGREAAWANLYTVHNQDPVIHSVDYSGSHQVGADTNFTAQITDPSPADTLKYVWDFGDGQRDSVVAYPDVPGDRIAKGVMKHAYAAEGGYLVTLGVEDDDYGLSKRVSGRALSQPMWVIIGDGGAFGASGDVNIPLTGLTGTAVMGVLRDSGLCQVEIHLAIGGEGTVTLQTIRDGGLAKGTYRIQPTTGFAGNWEENLAAPGAVTAYFGPERKHTPPGRTGLFGFGSRSGELTIGDFDGKVVSGIFTVRFEENTSFTPTKAQVQGYFRIPVSNQPIGLNAIENHFYGCPVEGALEGG